MVKQILTQLARPRVQALIVAGAGLLLAFAPDLYVFMLARAFLWPWAAVFMLIALVSAGMERWWPAAAALTAGSLIWMAEATGKAPTAISNGHTCLRVAQMNLYQYNERHEAVLQAALDTHADLISVQEVDSVWSRVFTQGLAVQYPYHCIEPQDDCYGIAVFSKLPMEGTEILHLGGRPAVTAVVKTSEGAVRFLAVHATSPGSYGEFRDRQQQLARLADLVATFTLPTLVIGDLNTASWDGAFRRLCAKTGLHEGGGAPRATWPATLGLPLTPLDHVLVSPQLGVASTQSFTIPGSDHRGLVAEITASLP